MLLGTQTYFTLSGVMKHSFLIILIEMRLVIHGNGVLNIFPLNRFELHVQLTIKLFKSLTQQLPNFPAGVTEKRKSLVLLQLKERVTGETGLMRSAMSRVRTRMMMNM